MKQILFSFGFLCIASLSSNAQEFPKNAIGLRFGTSDGFGAAISYQRKIKEKNRLEVNIGLKEYDNFKASGIYQWVWKLEDQFNWYAGAGAGVHSIHQSSVFFTGGIGVEYHLKPPFLISLDYRPEFSLNLGNGFQSDIALSIRYRL